MKTLSGIERPMTTVGRRVLNRPRTTVGRMVSMKANTTDTANRKPKTASLRRLSICFCMSGPWSETTMISTSGGRPSSRSSASRTAVVTSMVLTSASLRIDTLMPGLPLVREMLVGMPSLRLTSATSPNLTGPLSGAATTRSSISCNESKVWVVLTRTAWPLSKTRPAGSVRLFSLRAEATWDRETPLSTRLSGLTATRTCRSTSPATCTCITPSISDSAGRMRERTTLRTPATPRSETTPNCITGIWPGLKRPTVGSWTPSTKGMPFIAAATSLSARTMSVPNSKVRITMELPSKVVD